MSATVKTGERVEFVYNGKPRSGIVDRVLSNRFTLSCDEGGFKSFRYDNCTNMQLVKKMSLLSKLFGR